MMGTVRIALALAVIAAAILLAGEPGLLPGPRDPIAADGSLKAGRALTIADLEPSNHPIVADLDDPRTFEKRFSGLEVEQYRTAILDLAELAGQALCQPDRHRQLVAAIQKYYGIKRFLNAEFHFRGPRASRFIDDAWMTPRDQQIEMFVRLMQERGYLRAREIFPQDRSFLLDVFVQDLTPSACSRS